MSDMQTNFKIRDRNGSPVEIPFHVSEYQEAAKLGMTLSQYLSYQHRDKTDESTYGSVIGQFMESAGMFLGEDVSTGLRPPSMKAMSTEGISLSAITRNDGSSRNTPSGRMLFPEIIMRTIESELRESNEDFLGGWERLIAQTASITGPKFDQPVINVTAPRDQASNPTSQLAEPDALVSITTSDYSKSIPTKSIGLLISDQAQEATTLDLVTLAMSAQARQERVRMVQEHIAGIVTGDTDRGMTALSSAKAKTLDSTITLAGTITHKAWIKYLRTNYQKRNISNIITTLDTAIAVESRSGKPTRDTVYAEGGNLPVDFTIDNLAARAPRVLIVNDGVIAANTLVGIDKRYAIRRVININAQYSAIEQYLMRRATGFRVDYGEIAHRIYDDAFDVITLTI